MRTQLPSVFLAAALACSLFAAPAQAAGAARTFLSAAGIDANNCTYVATPCRHMAAAYAATAPNGEIYVLDPANYGSLTITGPVSIEGHGWASIAPTSHNPAININANPGDKINIIGVVLDGTALATTTGIQFNSGGTLTVRDSVIRNFDIYGIYFFPAAASQLLVSNTIVSDNGPSFGAGIYIVPTQTSHVTLNRVELSGNSNGLFIDGNSLINNGVAWVSVNDSTISGSAVQGILANNTGNPNAHSFISAIVSRSSIVDGANTGIASQGTGVNVQLNQSTIANNGAGWSTASGGTVTSFGNNAFSDFAGAGDGPPTPSALK
jgi:hypothetical protein